MEQPRDDHGRFVSLDNGITLRDLGYLRELLEAKLDTLSRELNYGQRALELQAAEYERRLTDLNHAHARAQELQATFLREDKYEDQTKAADAARELALSRIDEQMKEIHTALSEARGAAEQAKTMALEQGRKNSRNIGIATIILTIIIALSNWLGTGGMP